MEKKKIIAHIMTLFAIFIWGITFVSTKIILEEYSPLKILFYRFLLAYIVLFLVHPKIEKFKNIKEELIFLGMGLCGVSLYFLAENIALQFTLASNVGLVLAMTPILTAILGHIFTDDEKLTFNLLLGFCIAILGVFCIVYNGAKILHINPIGDILALLAGLIWSFYSILLKKVDKTYNKIFVVRKTFFYGLITTVPIFFLFNESFLLKMPSKIAFLNFIFLGVIASALCYVVWNKAVGIIGAIKASNYIYLIPLITMFFSVIILKEKITSLMLIGGIMILIGVYISEKGIKHLKKRTF